MKNVLNLLQCRKPSEKKLIWIMRQAGRYLPEYIAVRKHFKSFIDFCLTPEAAAEVTLQPIKRFGFDAAIIFSDILIIPQAMGINVDFIEGFGPKLFGLEKDINKISNIDRGVFTKVAEAIRMVRSKLDNDFPGTTLIGFAGAPWTVAAYITEGKGSKTFSETFRCLYNDGLFFDQLINTITDATIDYLKIQIEAGADVIKLFDSWSGLIPDTACLGSKNLYQKYIIDPTAKIISELKKSYPNAPVIGFPRGSGYRYDDYAAGTGVDCLAIDQNIALDIAVRKFPNITLQGNFDNMLLAYGSQEQIIEEAKRIVNITHDTSHIFNLGHGILPQTPIKNVEVLIDTVRKL